MGLSRRRFAIVSLALLAVLAAPAPPAAAHDFGSLSINVYSRLTVEASRVQLRWVLDMAEIPAGAIVPLIDQDGDGSASEEEKAAYFATWISSVLEQIKLTVDGDQLTKSVLASELELPTGENGALYLRVVLDVEADLPPAPVDGEYRASYQDLNYAEYVGWREVVVTTAGTAELTSSTVAQIDRTDELQTYPPDLGATTPNSEAEFSFRIVTGEEGEPGSAAATPPRSAVSDDLLALGLVLLAVVTVVVSVLVGLTRGRAGTRARR